MSASQILKLRNELDQARRALEHQRRKTRDLRAKMRAFEQQERILSEYDTARASYPRIVLPDDAHEALQIIARQLEEANSRIAKTESDLHVESQRQRDEFNAWLVKADAFLDRAKGATESNTGLSWADIEEWRSAIKRANASADEWREKAAARLQDRMRKDETIDAQELEIVRLRNVAVRMGEILQKHGLARVEGNVVAFEEVAAPKTESAEGEEVARG